MTNDEIQELAYQAEESITDGGTNYHWEFCVAFAKLVAAAAAAEEREECARVVEEPWQGCPKEIAAAIRARRQGWPKAPKDSDLLDRVENVVRRAILAEREACAQVCDKMVDQEIRTGKVDHNEMPWTMYCANIIRARGQE